MDDRAPRDTVLYVLGIGIVIMAAVAVLIAMLIPFFPSVRRAVGAHPKTEVVQKVEVTKEQMGAMREVVEKTKCSKILAVRSFEKRTVLSGMLYENHMALEDGRRVTDESMFIKKLGDLFCESRVEYVN